MLQAIVSLEEVPAALKLDLIVPVYKGGARDPMDVGSYRGITLASVLAKLLEIIIIA